ncbi:MAG: transporter [bacterium]
MLVKKAAIFLVMFYLLGAAVASAQNCCAPAVPQQGVVGETVALPHTLEVGLYFELLRSRNLYHGSEQIDDPAQIESDWQRASLALAYGLSKRFSLGVVLPLVWKEKSKLLTSTASRITNSSDGLGDLILQARYALSPRNWSNVRELSVGLAVKAPTGATDVREYGLLLPQELQPGSGSWDFYGSASYYQGWVPADILLSATYALSTEHEGYRFGNQFSFLLSGIKHLHDRFDLSLAISGALKAKDDDGGELLESTGREQVWIVPGLQYVILWEKLRLFAYFELPVYQHFNGIQLGSDYNLRFSLNYALPLGSE